MRTLLLVTLLLAPVYAQTAAAPAPPTLEWKEEFLRTAQVLQSKEAAKGITGTMRAMLTNGSISHEASIQRINEEKAKFEGTNGTEMNFRDTWKFNIAAYRLGRMLGLGDMIPPSVERKFSGDSGAFTWWVEDVLMDEVQRRAKKIEPPNKEDFNRQYVIMQVFDNLIYNTDRNRTNILFDKNWKLWMIDHTRAFRTRTDLLDPKALKMCDRQLLANMKALTLEKMKPELSPYLRDTEIKGILTRRDKLVKFYEAAGDKALFDYLPKP
jgi:hypothetical protein